MRIILLFILNAGFNLVLGFAIAAMLGPAEYGRFAIGMTTAVVLATGAFDWLRLSATRFYGEARRASEPDLRATLDAAYLVIGCILAVGLAAALMGGLTIGLGTGLLAAAVLSAVSNGLFDFGTALARARFHNRIYGAMIVVRNVAALGLGCAAALLLHDPALVLGGVACGALVAVAVAAGGLRDRAAPLRLATLSRLRAFAGYGMPVVAANVVFQIIVLLNRSTAASSFGFAEAGRLSLATDMGLRLFLAVGAAVDVFVFQLAVRREAEQGHEAAQKQLRINAKIVVAVLLLLAVGYAASMPALEALVVPVRYRGAFGSVSLILLPGLVLFCVGQFAINPVFQIVGRTRPIVLAALATLAADALGLALLPHSGGVMGVALVHSASLTLGAGVILLLALRQPGMFGHDGDLLRIALAAAVTSLALWPLRGLDPPWLALAGVATVGPAAYTALLLILDVGGLRGAVADWRSRAGRLAEGAST